MTRAMAALAEIAARYPGRLDVVAGDALDFDPLERLAGSRARIVANLPYNIATALLVALAHRRAWPPLVRSAGADVPARGGGADRRRARIQSLRPAVGARRLAHARPRILFDIAPSAFVPPPKVTSSLVELVPRAAPLPCDSEALQRVTEAAFGQRRKMLRQSLKSLGAIRSPLLEAAGIAPTARAEDIPVEGFVRLARASTETARLRQLINRAASYRFAQQRSRTKSWIVRSGARA